MDERKISALETTWEITYFHIKRSDTKLRGIFYLLNDISIPSFHD